MQREGRDLKGNRLTGGGGSPREKGALRLVLSLFSQLLFYYSIYYNSSSSRGSGYVGKSVESRGHRKMLDGDGVEGVRIGVESRCKSPA